MKRGKYSPVPMALNIIRPLKKQQENNIVSLLLILFSAVSSLCADLERCPLESCQVLTPPDCFERRRERIWEPADITHVSALCAFGTCEFSHLVRSHLLSAAAALSVLSELSILSALPVLSAPDVPVCACGMESYV